MTPEEVLEAIEQVRGSFRGRHNVTAIYRACIERGLLQRERIAPNTFRRMVKAHELLKPDAEVREQAPLGLRQGARQRALAGRHHVWSVRAARCWQGADQAHRLPRRRQPRLLPRRVLPGREHRDAAQSLQDRPVQAGRLRVPLRRQRQHLLVPGDHAGLPAPRRHPVPHAGARRGRQGQDRALSSAPSA